MILLFAWLYVGALTALGIYCGVQGWQAFEVEAWNEATFWAVIILLLDSALSGFVRGLRS